MHAYFGSACFIFQSIERDNAWLAFYLLCAIDGICHVPLHSSFFRRLKSSSLFYTHHADAVLYLWSTLYFYKNLKRYWEAKWHCRATPSMSETTGLSKRSRFTTLLLKLYIIPQTTSPPAGCDCSRFSLRWLLVLLSPPHNLKLFKHRKRRGLQRKGIVSMLRLLKDISIIKAKIVSMSDAVRR